MTYLHNLFNDNVSFQDEIGTVLINLINQAIDEKKNEVIWRGLIGKDTYKVGVKLVKKKPVSIFVEKR